MSLALALFASVQGTRSSGTRQSESYGTGQEAQSREHINFYSFQDPHIRLRELLYLDEQLISYQQRLPDQNLVATDENSLEDNVRTFFEDVFCRKAGLGS